METQLRELAKNLLESGKADVVIGYGRHHDERRRAPVFVTDPADVERLVFDERCLNNLAGYLNKRYKLLTAEFSKPAVVLKGCDAKAAVGLIQEAQFAPGDVTLIGVCCSGVLPDHDAADGERPFKCAVCDVHRPKNTAHVVGDLPEDPALTEFTPSELATELAKKSREERYAFWREELAKCIRCYACRAACPLCSCERCIADSNQPQWVPTSGHELGNWSWNIVRAFHLAGRCIGCGECQRACPVGIPLDLLNQHLRKVVAERFGYVAGLDPEARPPLTTYTEKDAEEFIK
jgi:ferredoxin